MTHLPAAFNWQDPSAPGHYKISQTALLLLDFHTLMVHKAGGPTAPAALEVAVRMRTWAKSQGIQVIHGIVDVDATPFSKCKGRDRLEGIVAAMNADSSGDEVPELLSATDHLDITFKRLPGHTSALKSPGLLEYLQDKGITSLVLAGLSTSGCVTRTSLSATDAEYVVTVLSDACADPADGLHDMMVGKILNNRGYVMTASDFQDGFAQAQERHASVA